MIETKQLTKSFQNGDTVIQVLKGIDFKLEDGEFISVMGRSGAGKSTFLYQMSLLDEPTSGHILIDGHRTEHMSSGQKTFFRLTHFGYVFQDYALLPELSALENVAVPLMMQNISTAEAMKKAIAALTRVGLQERLYSLPARLSGGEQQRVSIARAVAHNPKVLFADEPTANLDNESAEVVMSIFNDLHKAGQTIIMVTHEEEYAKNAEKIVHMDNGLIVSVDS